MKFLLLSIAVFITVSSGTVQAQSKEEEKYRQQSEEIRKNIWAWDKPQFKVKTIPAEYANASKVIIAHHTEISADSKTKFAYNGTFGFGTKKEQTITEVVRELIKVNDKNSVTEYSEFSFTQFVKSSGFYSNDKTTTYIGVRVIKPDGSMKEINADDIVLTKDAFKKKEAKVAIPDLQPGDILDYFIATEQSLTNDLTNKPYRIVLFDDAPILSQSFHGQLSKKYGVDYRSYNGAPELKVSKNEEGDIIIDVEKNNISPFETSFWVASGQQLPFIHLNISLGYKALAEKYTYLKKQGEASKNTDANEFIEEMSRDYSRKFYNEYCMSMAKQEYVDILIDAKKKARQGGISFIDMPDEEKAAFLYYTLRFTKLLNFSIDKMNDKINIGYGTYNGLSFPLFGIMEIAELNPAIMVSTDRTGLRMSEIMGTSDLITNTYLPASNKFLSLKSVYDIPFSVPSEIEGMKNTKSFTFDKPRVILSPKKISELTIETRGPNVPVTDADRNTHIENLSIVLAPDNTNLTIKRSTTMKGFYKTDVQSSLILYEDFYESERKAFKEEKSLVEELEEDKRGKKYADEVRNAFTEARKNQKDAFIREAKNWFEQDVTELKDHKTDNLGVRHTSPDFIYSSNFNLAGLVKKAGNNIIVEIGKIQGQPLAIKEEQRKRDLDVFMPFARSIEYNITFDIPAGYTAEGIAALNKNVENETGFFKAEATATEKTITIKVKKSYLNNFEPAKNWEKLVAFLDAANDWVGAKFLLKKI